MTNRYFDDLKYFYVGSFQCQVPFLISEIEVNPINLHNTNINLRKYTQNSRIEKGLLTRLTTSFFNFNTFSKFCHLSSTMFNSKLATRSQRGWRNEAVYTWLGERCITPREGVLKGCNMTHSMFHLWSLFVNICNFLGILNWWTMVCLP